VGEETRLQHGDKFDSTGADKFMEARGLRTTLRWKEKAARQNLGPLEGVS
jgi:hypothetical protein